jgi:thioredoxin 1
MYLESSNLTEEISIYYILKHVHMSTDTKSSEWDSLISGKNLVAAEFWAPWCPYCLRLRPIFDAVAKDSADDIKFVKVDVGQEPDLASRYGVQSIPVIKFFCEGKEVGEIVGYLPQDALAKEVEKISRNTPNCLANTSLMK